MRFYRLILLSLLAQILLVFGCSQQESTVPVSEDGLIVGIDTTWENGLSLRDIELGTGAPIDSGDYFRVHYTAYLSDGDIFDTSIGRNESVQFKLGVGQVLEAWDMGIHGMRAGGKRIIYSPPELGFGVNGIPGIIPAGDTIRFEVELLEVRKSPKIWPIEDLSERITESGIYYFVHQNGRGSAPSPGDLVAIHYSGYLQNGNLFDSSHLRDDYFRFKAAAGQVITGLDEMILHMREGERRTIVIPPDLAYGQRGQPGIIPPNSTLRFDIELIEIGRSNP